MSSPALQHKKSSSSSAPIVLNLRLAPSSPQMLCAAAALFALALVGSGVQQTDALPLELLRMYSPNEGKSPAAFEQAVLPLKAPPRLKLSNGMRQIANAYLVNEVAKVRQLEDMLNGGPKYLVAKRLSDGAERLQENADSGEEAQADEENLLRAGRNIDMEVAAPKLYARHIGDLGGTMFRFGR